MHEWQAIALAFFIAGWFAHKGWLWVVGRK